MNKMKQLVALTVVGVLAVLAAGWMFLVSPKRSEASDLRDQAAQAETKNTGLEAKLATLKAQAKQLPQYQAKLAQVAAKIPNNPALPSLIRALTKAADNAGVELVTVAPTTPAAFTPGATAAAPASRTATGSTSTAASAPAGAPASLQQITLTLNVVGGYFETEQFFDQVEKLTRAVKVTGLTMAPGTSPVAPTGTSASTTDGRTLTTAITAMVFMSPPALTAAATAPVK